MTDKRFLRVIFSIAVIGIAIYAIVYISNLGSSPNAAQQAEIQSKKIERKHSRNEPFEFIDLKAKGLPVKLGEAFGDRDPDWIKHIQFKLKNTSNKPITYIYFEIDYPETKSDKPMIASQMNFGQSFNSKVAQTRPPLFIIPGDTFVFSLTDDHYSRIRSFLENNGHRVSDLSKIQIRFLQIQFADDTMWDTGYHYTRDPSRPGGWRKVER